jgi:hypothetical protein
MNNSTNILKKFEIVSGLAYHKEKLFDEQKPEKNEKSRDTAPSKYRRTASNRK